MPPPPSTSKRMTANPIRPSRYRPGKAAQEEASSSEASGDEAEDNSANDESQQQQKQTKPTGPPKFQSGKTAAAAASNLKNLNLEERRKAEVAREKAAKEEERRERERVEREAGFVTESESGSEDEDEEQDETQAQGKGDTLRPASRAQGQKQAPQRRTGSTSEDEEESEEEGSSSEDSSSESDTPDPRLKRPIFVRKADRQPSNTHNPINSITATPPASTAAPHHPTASPKPTNNNTASDRKTEQTNALIQSTIDARLAASADANKQWDDEAISAELDDTDGLDPELEHAQWVARELARLKRSRAALEEREAEIAEVERRRNLSTPEREKEDRERIAEQERREGEKREAAKASGGGEGYMRRYHHKGAFTAGDEEKERELRERDLMTAEYEGDVRMKGALPQYLQVRDSSMIGRKGRQRHRDLRSEDTGRWGGGFGGGTGRGGRYDGGGSGGGRGDYANEPLPEDERFRPDRPGDVRGATGANAGALGERKRPYGEDRQRDDEFKRPRREEVR